jgi:NTP pyrophosphatase (non-canonical NTP hydrolase)
MNLDEYQKEASRTECNQGAALNRIAGGHLDDVDYSKKTLVPTRMNHALIGLTSELGELAKLFENWIYYGGDEPNTAHLLEEVGDVMWRLAELCNAMGIRLQCAIDANIAKLKVRYPEKWTGEKADRANRNKEAERNAIVEIMEKAVGDEKDYPLGKLRRIDPKSEMIDDECPQCKGLGWMPPHNEMNSGGVCGVCKGTGTTKRPARPSEMKTPIPSEKPQEYSGMDTDLGH